MNVLPEGLEEDDLIASLADGWGLDAVSAQYLALGFGSYHWVVAEADGRRHFITVDDLDRKGYLGHTRDSALEGLRRAFDTALELRQKRGLEFVVAPVPTVGGEVVRRIGPRHTVAVFPFIEGRSRRYERIPPEERADVVRMLIRLHLVTPATVSAARPATVQLSGRDGLEAALRDLGRPWEGGPFSEQARRLLDGHKERVLRLLESFDRLRDQVATTVTEPVITHGEPHGGNLVRTGGRLVLVDWDTVGLAPPERDLWMVDSGTDAELRLYAEESGRRVDEAALALYRIRWKLDDIAIFVNQFRAPHDETADTEKAWLGFTRYLQTEDDWPFGPG